MDTEQKNWIERNRRYTFTDPDSGFALNLSGIRFDEKDLAKLDPLQKRAFDEVRKIEAGEVKNVDENRKVTHFTDRAIYTDGTLYRQVEDFAERIRTGTCLGSTGKRFSHAVINGIGGSALGPQLVQFAIRGPHWNELDEKARGGRPRLYFTDNTDPSGIRDILDVVDLQSTLVVHVSKSGGTQETRNNQIAFADAFRAASLDPTRHFCAITMPGSDLDKTAKSEKWLEIFAMAESIGGRTSETNIVGHVPAALTGISFKELLKGACRMDEWTRASDWTRNPAYMLAAIWHIAGSGRGDRNMVIVPYSDRLVLLSRYLQQLVMESLGKKLDRSRKCVHQGLNVFGNKGGTDAHAFIQQLCDGRDDFFITFIEVLRDARTIPIENGLVMGDFLHGFQAGLAEALYKTGRQVIQMAIRDTDAFNLGMIIALYERTVAVYAELINVNAFHQPGVQAYKKEAGSIIRLLSDVQSKLATVKGFRGSVAELAERIGMPENEIGIAGIVAKFSENQDARQFSGFTIRRKWKENDWEYSVS